MHWTLTSSDSLPYVPQYTAKFGADDVNILGLRCMAAMNMHWCMCVCCYHDPESNWTGQDRTFKSRTNPQSARVQDSITLEPGTKLHMDPNVSVQLHHDVKGRTNDNSSVGSWLGHVHAQHSGAQIMRSHWRDLVRLWDGWSCHPLVNSYHLISRAIRWYPNSRWWD